MSAALTQLATSGLVGLARKPPVWPVVSGGIGEVLAEMEGGEAEVRFLRTAGVLSFAVEAGQETVKMEGVLPAAPAEDVRTADTPRLRIAAMHLISAGPVEVLIEMLDLLTQKRLTLPADLLPPLLVTSTNKPALREAIGRLPGQRHRWLASLNPDWQAILSEEVTATERLDERQWTEGSLPERIAVLRQIREQEPARAREMLAAAISKEAAKERADMLLALTTGFSLEDEPFLTSVLADKSKSVRQCAATMLSAMPGSAFAQRITELLVPIVKLEKKLLRAGKLEIAMPEKFDPVWARDGVEEKPLQGEGAKAFWLRQMVSSAPLDWWTGHFGQEPGDVIALMAKSDWAAPLLTGVMTALIAQQRKTWARALIAHGPVKNVYLDFAEIAAVAGREATEQWLTGMTQQGEFNHALGHAVQLKLWSAPFATLMLERSRRVASKEPDYTFFMHLPAVALRLPASLLAAAETGWESLMDKPYLRSALDTFLQNIQLRKAIHEELAAFLP